MKIHASSHVPWIIVSTSLLFSYFAYGQITPTAGSFETGTGMGGTTFTNAGGLVTIPATSGKQVGGNLFHSFDTFTIDGTTITGAKFTDAGATQTINNVVARVTGSSASTINGTLSTQSVNGANTFAANVNLFLINPQGVIFGPNASISVPGNFVSSTANYVVLGDNTSIFYSDPTTGQDAGLTMATGGVTAFGFFGGSTPKPINVTTPSLSNAGGLQFVGGNFNLAPGTGGTAASLSTTSSILSVFSIGTAGSGTNASGAQNTAKDSAVPFLTGGLVKYAPGTAVTQVQNTTSFGNVTFGTSAAGTVDGTAFAKGSATATASGAGGHVVIRGGVMVVQNQAAPTQATVAATGGSDITIEAQTLSLVGNSSITSTATGGTTGGDVDVTTDQTTGTPLALGATTGGAGVTGSGKIQALVTSGTSGNVNVDSGGPVALVNGSVISSAGGAVTMGANTPLGGLSLDGTSSISNTGAGTIAITAATAGTITDNGQISTVTGQLSIDAASMLTLATGSGNIASSGGNIKLGSGTALGGLSLASGTSIATTGTGVINITTTGTATVTDNGGISTATGNLTVDGANAVTLASGTNNLKSSGGNIQLGVGTAIGGLSVASGTSIATTGAGTVNIKAKNSATVAVNGQISTGTGNITIDGANAVNLTTGTNNITSTSGNILLGSTGALGGLTLDAGTAIKTGTTGAIKVTTTGTATVTIDGQVSNTNGDIDIDAAQSVTLTGGTIASSGNINLGATTKIAALTLDSGSALQENGTTGAITILSTGAVNLQDTNATGGGMITSASAGGINLGTATAGQTIGSLTVGGTSAITESGSGAVGVHTGGAVVLNGTIDSVTTSASDAGELTIDAGSLNVNGGTLSSKTTGAGAAGAITVGTSGTAMVKNGGMIESLDEGTAAVTGGTVSVTASGALSVASGGQIFSFSNGANTAVDVSASGAGTTITGPGTATAFLTPTVSTGGVLKFNAVTPTGVFSAASGAGDVGGVTVSSTGATALTLSAGGQIGSLNAGMGTAPGTVTVTSGGTLGLTTVAQILSAATAAGTGADLDVISNGTGATALTLDGANTAIFSQASGAGAAGAVGVSTTAGTLALTNNSAISSLNNGTAAVSGGNVTVGASGPLTLASGAQIFSFTNNKNTAAAVSASGTGVTITGGGTAVDLSGTPTVANNVLKFGGTAPTGIFSAASGAASGNVGGLTVAANGTGSLALSAGGQIGSINAGSGAAPGAVTITSGGPLSLLTNAEIATITTGIQSGAAVGITANDTGATPVTINGATLLSQTTSVGAGGSLSLNATGPGTVTLTGGGLIESTTSAYNNGVDFAGGSGAVSVTAAGDIVLGNSTNHSTGIIQSASTGDGIAGVVGVTTSGNLTLNAASAIQSTLTQSLLTDTATTARTGNVSVSVPDTLTLSSTAFIQTIATPAAFTTSGGAFYDPLGKVSVQAQNFFEGGNSGGGSGTAVGVSFPGSIYYINYGPNIQTVNNTSTANLGPVVDHTLVTKFIGNGTTTASDGLLLDGSLMSPAQISTGLANNTLIAVATPSGTQYEIVPVADGPGFDYNVSEADGTLVNGTNLFLSFSQFNLGLVNAGQMNQTPVNESAIFNVASSVKNIFVRVFGSPSYIAGLIESANTGTNLYILNPGGITFINGGNIQVEGSFTVTSASSIALANGGTFQAAGSTDSMITPTATAFSMPNVSAFGFAQGVPGTINFSSVTIASNSQLQVIGGPISVTSSSLSSFNSQLLLFSAGGGGTLQYNSQNSLAQFFPSSFAIPFTFTTALGSIDLENSSLTGIGINFGANPTTSTLFINGGSFTLNNSILANQTLFSSLRTYDPGDIIINAPGGTVSITGSATTAAPNGANSEILASTNADQNGGSVVINAANLSIANTGSGTVGINSNAEPGQFYYDNTFNTISDSSRVGNGGNITVNLTNGTGLTMSGNSVISADTNGGGNGGTISLNVQGNISLTNGAQVSSQATSTSAGSAGSISITQSGSIGLVDPKTVAQNGLTSNGGVFLSDATITTANNGPGGMQNNPSAPDAGTISITADAVTMRGYNSEINSSTNGQFNAGQINITAGAISLDEGAIFSITNSSAAPVEGTGGTITIHVTGNNTLVPGATGDLSITNDGELFAYSSGNGDAGSIVITQTGSSDIVDPKTVDPVNGTNGGFFMNEGFIFTGSFGNGPPTGSVSSAPIPPGTVSISADVVTITNDSEISSATASSSSAGPITITAGAIAFNQSFIFSSAYNFTFNGQSFSVGSGNGALVKMTATGDPMVAAKTGDVTLSGGEIQAISDGPGDAGEIQISQSGSSDIVDPTLVGTINGPAINGGVYISNGGQISTSAQSVGPTPPATSTDPNAGAITIDTQALTATGGAQIDSSTSGFANAGAITVAGPGGVGNAQFVVLNGATVNSNTDGGSIPFGSPVVAGYSNGGTIAINAGALTISGGSTISTNSVGGPGNGGDVMITVAGNSLAGATGDVTIHSGSISASSNTTGDAGQITIVQSGSTVIDPSLVGTMGNPLFNGGVYVDSGSISTSAGGTGKSSNNAIPPSATAGNIVIDTQALTLHGGTIDTSTDGLSKAGELIVNGPAGGASAAQFVLLQGNSTITSDTSGAVVATNSGKGGTIAITAGGLGIDNSTISTNSAGGTGSGGDIILTVAAQTGVIGATGDVTLLGGTISASSVATGDAGQIGITQSGSTDITDPTLNPATNGGLFVNGGFILTKAGGTGNSPLNTAPTPSAQAGDITIHAQAVTLTGGGQINSSTSGLSKAGEVNLTTGALTITGSNSAILSSTDGLALTNYLGTFPQGAGGSITVNVTENSLLDGETGDIAITNGGAITAFSEGTGFAGTVMITQSGSLDVTDPALNPMTNGGLFLNDGSISTAALGTGTDSTANASVGDIILNVQALTALGGSQINASTSGLSKAGDITISGAGGGLTQFVALQGGSTIASQTLDIYGFANSKNVNLSAGSPIPPFAGEGGTIVVDAGSLSLDGAGTKLWTASSNGFSGVTSSSGNGGQINNTNGGDGGQITLTMTKTPGTIGATGGISVTNGASISASSLTTGGAGRVTIASANDVLIDGANSNISTDAGPNGNTGNTQGDITVNAANLSIGDGASISATTGLEADGITTGIGLSPGGTITLEVPGVISVINGSVIDASSSALGIVDPMTLAVTTPGGNGGSINIGGGTGSGLTAVPNANSPSMLNVLNGSQITAGSLATTGGNITIFANTVNIQNSSSVETKGDGANNNGGSILIDAGSVFYLNQYSDISTHSGGVGGNITIDPEFEVLNHSFIDAFGGSGDGNVVILSNFTLSGDSSITATGTVTIASLPLDLSGSLVGLPADLTDEAKRLRESCARAVNHEFSSLIVVGRSGTETAPDELNSDSGSSDGGAESASAVRVQKKLR